MIEITMEEYLKLVERSDKLAALEAIKLENDTQWVCSEDVEDEDNEW